MINRGSKLRYMLTDEVFIFLIRLCNQPNQTKRPRLIWAFFCPSITTDKVSSSPKPSDEVYPTWCVFQALTYYILCLLSINTLHIVFFAITM